MYEERVFGINMNDLVSIIMPVFNAEKFVNRAINSVLEQSYKNFQLIIINDGSTDRSKEICHEFSQKDSRIFFINQKNAGPSSARNHGLQYVKGEYVMFLDADDTLEKKALETLVHIFAEKSVDLCVYAWNTVSETKKVAYKYKYSELHCTKEQIYNNIVIHPFKCGGGFPWNKIWRTKKLRDQGKIILFDERLSSYEDKLWVLKCMDHIEKICFLNMPLYNYYIQENSSSHYSTNELEKLYQAYNAALIINEYISLFHVSAKKNADKLVWLFLVNYVFGAELQKKNGNRAINHVELRNQLILSGIKSINIKAIVKYVILYLNMKMKKKAGDQ